MSRNLFGTSGIRGHAEKLFTPSFCFDIGRTFVTFLKKNNILGPIAVAMDPRTSSPRIKSDLFLGLATSRVELFDEGVAPIPSVNWLIKNTPIKAAVMITGSHISAELNGMKFYAHDEEISEKDQEQINSIYWQIKGNKKLERGKVEVQNDTGAVELYKEMLLGKAKKPLPKFKIGLDCANGAQSVVFPSLLDILGLEVIGVNCDPQKDFIARDTDTDDKAELESLKKVVVGESCDFGIAFDGDGDRSVFVDEKGTFIPGEYSCSLIAKELDADKIITTVSASQVVETLGKRVIRTKVGSPYVVGKMKEEGSKFGFEQNGGAIFADTIYTRDGGSVTIEILNLFAKFRGKFSKMVATLPKYHMFRTKVDYKWELQDKILQEAKKNFRGIKIEEIDGVKIWMDKNTWLLFRSSQNAPEFRVFAESLDKEKAQKLLQEGVSFVKKMIS